MTDLQENAIDGNECEMLDGDFPRFLLNPFEVIRPSDPRYETALTREELIENSDKPSK